MTTLAEPFAVIDTPWGPATVRRPQRKLPGGHVGYFRRALDDCLRAAVATATQIPYDEVAPVMTLQQLGVWAHEVGLQPFVHTRLPTDLKLWIGCSPVIADGAQPDGSIGPSRHCVVCSYDRIYFDPNWGWEFPGGRRCAPTTEFDHAISFERKES